MASLIGKRLSHYRVLRRIGAGGMGHVYSAVDERSGRQAAVKVLPEGILAGAAERRLFRREILALSEVRHPNIASVYDFESQGDVVFLAMEYVEGGTLADRLREGPLSVPVACSITARIADALCVAHARGVLHRDLKPSNVALTPLGGVKLLDFGLAKRVGARALAALPDAVTVTQARTAARGRPAAGARAGRARASLSAAAGVGTPGYMSPEQVAGAAQDPRTDVFSFGCILYECLAGKPAFPGATPRVRLAAGLAREPGWSALPEGTPLEVRKLLVACLSKRLEGRPTGLAEARSVLRRFAGAERDTDAPAPAPVPNNLPEAASPFIGRHREVEEGVERLKRARLLTVVGPGGAGKTRLALRIAEASSGRYPGGAWFLDLARVASADRIPGLLAAALGEGESAGGDPWERFGERFRSTQTLIVLDNCEDLLETVAPPARDLLARFPTVSLLATSRDAFGISGEETIALGPLSVPHGEGDLTADSIAPYDSVALFLARGRAADPSFDLTDATAPVVAAICRKLDGIPLALELAAARLRVLSVRELLDRLEERFAILARAGAGEDPRHATLQGVIAWSYEHLSASEQEALRAVAAFAGAPTLQAVRAVWGDAGEETALLDHLKRLVDRSMVSVRRSGDGETRYALLESVRAYARNQAAAVGETARLADRHLQHYLHFLAGAEGGLRGTEQTSWLARLDEEHDDVLAALAWCRVPPGRPDAALAIVNAVWRFWYLRGYFATGRRALEAALEGGPNVKSGAPRAKALRSLAMLMDLSGEYARSRPLFEESLAISRRLGDEQGIAFSQNGLAGVAMNLGDHAAARALYEEVERHLRGHEDPVSLGIVLGNLGASARYMGDYRAAERYFTESVRGSARAGDQAGRVLNLSVLASTCMSLGKLGSARRKLIEAIEIAARIGERRALAFALKWTGDYALARGELEWAARCYGAADAVRKAVGAVLWTDESSEMKPVREARRKLGEARFREIAEQAAAISEKGSAEIAADWLRTQREGARPTRPQRAGSRRGRSTRPRKAPIRRERSSRLSRPPRSSGPARSTALILSLARKGDAHARDMLGKRFIPVLRRWAHGRLPDASRDMIDTDDIVQVALIRAFRRLDAFSARGEGAFLAYLRKIVVNCLRDEWRRTKKRPIREELPVSLAAAIPSPLHDAMRRRTMAAYERELGSLPRKTREAVVLRVEMNYDHARVAEAVGLPSAGAARMLVKRGLERLSARLGGSRPGESHPRSRARPRPRT